MKYLGEKSLSSFLSGLCGVSWYIVLVLAVIGGTIGSYLFFTPIDDPFLTKMAQVMELDINDKDWVAFKNLPLVIRMLCLPWLVAVVVLILKLIKKAQNLFNNFKKNIVFDPANVSIIESLSKLLIPFSILTFNFSSLATSLLLFLLCEIFKNGTVLQQEHDLTI
jgi:hypothetical protein